MNIFIYLVHFLYLISIFFILRFCPFYFIDARACAHAFETIVLTIELIVLTIVLYCRDYCIVLSSRITTATARMKCTLNWHLHSEWIEWMKFKLSEWNSLPFTRPGPPVLNQTKGGSAASPAVDMWYRCTDTWLLYR